MADTSASTRRLHVHALDLGRAAIEQANGAASDRLAVASRDQERPTAGVEIFGFEVGSKPLLGWIQLGETRVKPADQTASVVTVERLGGDMSAHRMHISKRFVSGEGLN